MEQSEILQYLAELTGIEGHAFHRAILLEVVVWFVMIAAVIIDFSTARRVFSKSRGTATGSGGRSRNSATTEKLPEC
mgnify:CR=1 FL=1